MPPTIAPVFEPPPPPPFPVWEVVVALLVVVPEVLYVMVVVVVVGIEDVVLPLDVVELNIREVSGKSIGMIRWTLMMNTLEGTLHTSN